MKSITYPAVLILFVLLTTPLVQFAQSVFLQNNETLNNEQFAYPWAGGMDAIQYCEIDLNIDGIFDLIAFDRRGNRSICFINNGTPNTIDYEYAPQYSQFIPAFSDWVIFKDYNMDGKNDIFTYSPGYASMMVYKNVSDNSLKFERVVYPYLKTLLPGGYVNLFVTNADYPGIADVDNDGDLDILTFGVLGSFIDMHKNMSMEKYGIPDSLDYEHYTYCWGWVAENDESNQLFYDTCFASGSFAPISERKVRHTGSTLLLHDFDDNGQVDLLLGDVDYPKLFALYNTGSSDNAFITSADTLFPSSTYAVSLYSMPGASYIDVNNDNIKDLIVSPFDPGIVTSRNKISSWLYINSGANNLPNFEYPDMSFLQKDMIDVGSGAYPVVFDWDGDGLKDLFVGNYGYYISSYYINYTLHSNFQSKIAYFKNVGTSEKPIFQLWENDFAGLGSLNKLGLIPTFDDIDGDGNTDLLVGDSEGSIIYVKYLQNDVFEVVSENYLNIDIGEFSSPQLFDINKDGLKDLLIGEKGGNINYYQNQGIVGASDFVYVTDSLGKVNVTDYSLSWDGFSTPSFFRDNDGNTGLVVGSEQGKIFYFKAIDNNLNGKFIESDQLNQLLDTTNVDFDRGMRTGASIVDYYSDGKLEMIIGNYSGGLEYFNGDADVNSNIISHKDKDKLNIYPNPATNEVTINLPYLSDYVIVSIYNTSGIICYYKVYNHQANNLNIDLSDIENGVYIVVTKFDNNIYTSRLIILK